MGGGARELYPQKFASEYDIFKNIRRGERIFIGSGCGEPQYLVSALMRHLAEHPNSLFGSEIFQVWTMGVAPYTDVKFKDNFRYNSFFVGMNARGTVNSGAADFTPVFLSRTPDLFRRKLVPVDVALVQATPPDEHGYMSLGVSVDLTLAALQCARLKVVQTNPQMPRVHGETFVHIRDVDFIVEKDEPLLEFFSDVPDEIAQRIGKNVARLVNDGDTIQVGYGKIPNAILSALGGKKNLGAHTELFTAGLADLMKKGVINNRMKTLHPNKTIASFCMGRRDTYDFINDNPGVEFRPIDYVNNPLNIARIHNMTAINSALQVDLTGQASAESVGGSFMSGIGGSADFMRGSVLAPGGKTILVIQSTAKDGKVSRIVPYIQEGAGVTLGRGDLMYLVTEYGIAYLHGKNIRERAMSIIAVAHPDFRPWLVEEAKRNHLIYSDQAFLPGDRGFSANDFLLSRHTSKHVEINIRPVRIDDEPGIKEFFFTLSERSMYRRFISCRTDIPHETLQEFVAIDHTEQELIVASVADGDREKIVGIAQFCVSPEGNEADAAVAVSDEYQGKGVGWELCLQLAHLGARRGLKGFTADVLAENAPIMKLIEKSGYSVKKVLEAGTYRVLVYLNK